MDLVGRWAPPPRFVDNRSAVPSSSPETTAIGHSVPLFSFPFQSWPSVVPRSRFPGTPANASRTSCEELISARGLSLTLERPGEGEKMLDPLFLPMNSGPRAPPGVPRSCAHKATFAIPVDRYGSRGDELLAQPQPSGRGTERAAGDRTQLDYDKKYKHMV